MEYFLESSQKNESFNPTKKGETLDRQALEIKETILDILDIQKEILNCNGVYDLEKIMGKLGATLYCVDWLFFKEQFSIMASNFIRHELGKIEEDE